MYIVFFGSDRGKVRDAASEYVDSRLSSHNGMTIIDAVDFVPGQIKDALGATSLFGGSECFVLDTPSDNQEFWDELKGVLAELAESSNTFIILEKSLLAAPKKKLSEHANEVTEFSAAKQERFNTFALAEALAAKDKRKLWVVLHEARLNGLRDEEVIGMLWWQLKSLRLAAVSDSAKAAGMKDFPFNKAKRSLSGFAVGEVNRLSQSLLELYHDGHAGVREMDLALEQWVLQV